MPFAPLGLFRLDIRQALLPALAIIVLSAGLGYVATPASAAAGDISGTVFDDENANGINDSEPGIVGIGVQAYDAAGAIVGTATTDGNGDYTLSGLTNGVEYRLEFDALPSGYESGPIGDDSEGSIAFASPETTGIDYGIHEPTACFAPGASALLRTFEALVTCTVPLDPTLPKDTLGVLDLTNTIPGAGRSDRTANTPMFHHADWAIDRIGNVLGSAIDNRRGDFFVTASTNYSHEFYDDSGAGSQPGIVQFGSIGGGVDSLAAAGTIYQLDATSGAASIFAVLPQQSTTVQHVACESGTVQARTTGPALGNIVYDQVNDQLFASNFEDGHVYRIAMDGTILDAYDFDANDNGNAGVSNGMVPYGLELSADSTRLYAGSLFGRQVWSVDLGLGGTFTGTAGGGATTVYRDGVAEQINQTISIVNEPQPNFINGTLEHFVSDLELLPNGEMLAGLRVGCDGSAHAAYNHTGQTHRLAANAGGFFTNDVGTLDISVQGDYGADDNYGGVGYRQNSDGSVDYAVTSSDMLLEAGPHGLAVFPSTSVGGSPISPLGGVDYGTPNDPKGVAGDVEILNITPCTPDELQIGNRVWLDLDQNGVQDPGESSLTGVTVSLYDASGSTIVATTTTGADGSYLFGTANGLAPNTSYILDFDVSTNTTPLPGGFTNGDLEETMLDIGAGVDTDSSDSDVINDQIAITTGGPGENNHTFDAGYSLPYDLALVKEFTSDTFGDITDGIVENGSDATFTITVTNQGFMNATSFAVTDYLPAGFILNDPAWTNNGDTTATINAGPLAAGESTEITVTVTADSAADGTAVNWAEISADDGMDIDSTPDTDQGNDNQPAAPGAATDDVIDNTAGDEDDHDPAGLTVVSYDLALAKVYTSDTSTDGNTSDGVIELGDDVTFTITVTNQGSEAATTFDVTDYMPVGFTLNDLAWTDNLDGTATRSAGPLASGASTDLTITMTATSPGAGDLVNLAEISADDGNDADSTPDIDATNDNQPAVPGAPTDDVIDNSDGDEDDHDIAPITVDAYDLALTKVYTSDTFGDTTDGLIENGTDVTFTITVTNQGTLDSANFEVVDYLPTGFALNDSGWTDNLDGTASFAGTNLLAGTSTDITITVTATAVSDGDYVNWAEIASDDGNDVDSTPNTTRSDDNQPSAPGDPTDDVIDNTLDGAGDPDEDDHDPAEVSVASYDLALTKVYTSDASADGNTTDGVIQEGDDVTFTITVTNQGSLDATTFTVTDYLPTGFSLNDAAWTDNGATATITSGPLLSGASTDITITLTADTVSPGTMLNLAEISADDGNDDDSSPDADATNDNQPAVPGAPTDDVIDNTAGDEDDHDIAGVTVSAYDLALTKVYTSDTSLDGNTSDGVIQPGDDVTFTITVTNQGSIDAINFSIVDYLPAGFSLNDPFWSDNGDNTATYDGRNLDAGDSVDIMVTLTADSPSAGDYVNWAEISSDDGADLDSTPDATQTNDNQPAAPGTPTDGVIDNSVDGAGDPDEDDHDPAPITVVTYDLALIKVYTSDTFGNTTDGVIENGSDVTFTITVTNQGTVDATSFEVTDYLPTGFSLNDAAWTDNGATATIAGGPLAAGASTDITITMTADTAAIGTSVNWAEISSDDGLDVDSTADTTPGNDNQPTAPGSPTDNVIDNSFDGAGDPDEDDHDPAGVAIANFDLALTKVYTADSSGDGNATDGLIELGDNVTFTITVTNQGTLDSANFTVVDYLPAGFILNDAAWFDNGDDTATFSGTNLVAGNSTDITITLTADSATDGDYVNWAEIATDDGFDIDSTPDTTPGDDNQPTAPGDPTDDVIDNTLDGAGDPDEDDHDPAPISVVSYDLALTKVYTSDASADGNSTDGVIQAGDDVTFTITVTNQGTIDATAFEVTDYLPTGFSLNDSAWTDNGSTATIAAGPLAAGDAVDLPITLTADTVTAGTMINVAEISTDDGNDVDSTPDSTVGNDNQPAAPGAPTDDVIDNTAGDEDDHDIAGVIISAYDLALIKVYTSDTLGNTTDGVIENGSDVTFTITVTNQGSLDAAAFEVTDHLPAGFSLNDAAWFDNGNDTATFSGTNLVAGTSTDITITLTADTATEGDHINWAEISSDDGIDGDSTPDSVLANDNQPAAPGAPTDDVIDNSLDGAGDPDEDDHDPAPITVATYDLALTKVYTSDTFGGVTDGVIENGSDVTFTITVTNQGTIDATSFEVTDYFPTGFSLNDSAWTDNGAGTATIAGGPLAAGDSLDLTITLTADAAIVGNSVNWAEISSDDGTDIDSIPNEIPGDDNQPAGPGSPTDGVIDNSIDAAGDPDEDDHDPAGVAIANFDLALTKVYTSDTLGNTTDGVIENGTDATFTITVTNQGTLDAATYSVIDHLPSGFLLNDAAWFDNGDGTATFSGTNLVAGTSTDITITLTADSATDGDYVNWAEISSDDGSDIDSTPDTTQANDNQPVAPGAPTDDVIDNSVDGAGDPDEDDHDPAPITVGSYDLALTKIYQSDTYTTTNDGVIVNGFDATFTITVTNQGSIDATTFEVTDYLPTGFSLNDAAWTDNGATATITGGPLAAGDSVDLTITLTADSAVPGDLINLAEISSDDGNDGDSTPDNDVANDNQPAAPGDPTDNVTDNSLGDEDDHDIAGLTVANYDLALIQVYTSDTFGVTNDGVIENGTDATFTITVTNQGTLDAVDYQVTEYLPNGFLLNDPLWADNGDGTATYSGRNLNAGDSTDITITLRADSVPPGDIITWAEISMDDGADIDSVPDTTQANDNQPVAVGDPTDNVNDNTLDGAGDPDEDDHDPAGLTVVAYDLALTKVYTSDTFGATTDGVIENGSDVTFTITVTNQGTVDAANYSIIDYIPSGFSLDDPAWTDNGDGTATHAARTLLAGTSSDVTITLTADTAGNGESVNWAEISADDGNDVDSTADATPGNDNQPTGPGAPTDDVIDNTAGDEDDHDPAGVTVASYDLALVKVYTSDTFGGATDGVMENGSDVTFTITVTNQGTIDASTFEVTDYLPAGFSLNDAAWTDNGDGTASRRTGPLDAGTSADLAITLTADSVPAGDVVNWAEISDDDGSDIDSTPDATQANDSQPTGPGSPTDDVIDNTAGDEDDHDPAGVTIDVYDLALTKAYTADTYLDPTDGEIEPGSDVTFTITVTNQGTVDAATFEVTDYLPAGFTLSDAAWSDNGNGTATIAGGPLAVGASVDIEITTTAGSVVPGSYVNWAEISADDGNDTDSTPDVDQGNDNQPSSPGDPTDDVIDNTAGDEDDHDPAQVGVANYDLALIKTYASDTLGNPTDGVVQIGSDVTFDINVSNQGTVDAASFELTDYFPPGFDLSATSPDSAAWTDNADGTATFTGGGLASGDTTVISITLTATTAVDGDYVNWAEISADDGNDIDSTTDTIPTNDNQPVTPGDPTDDVTNNAVDGAGDPDEDDHDPAPISVASYDLALTKVYTSDTSGAAADGVMENGSDVTFTITVTNQGSIDAATFEVTDYLPSGFSLNDPAWVDNGDDTATFTGGPIAVGASTDITITLTADSVPAGDVVNWAEISGDDGDDVDSTTDTDPANDSQPAGPGAPTDDVIDNTAGDEDDHDPAGVTIDVYDLALIKTYTSDTSADGNSSDGLLQIGDDVTFTITVTNQGTVDAASADVTDYAPAGFTLNDVAWTDNGDGTATRAIGALAAGASTDMTIAFTVTASGGGELINRAEISADDGNDVDSTEDADRTNDAQPNLPGDPTDDVIDNTDGDEDDHDIAGVTVDAFDLALIKQFTSDTFDDPTDGQVAIGSDATFTISLINQGTVDAIDTVITDYIPAGFVLNDSAWTDNGDGTASITVANVASAATREVTITLTVVNASIGTVDNLAEISSDNGTDADSTPNTDPGDDGPPVDDNTDNSGGDEDDHDPAPITVIADVDLALIKIVDAAATTLPVTAGADVTFTITVINQGANNANAISVIDYVDPAMWAAFDVADNPAGTTTGDAVLGYTWTAAGADASVSIAGTLDAGNSITVPVTLTIAPGADLTSLLNTAEISEFTPLNPDGSPLPGVTDKDSTPDTTNDDVVRDDVVDNTDGDEDDHDIATVVPPTFSLGNQVWLDPNNNGIVDAGETGIADVAVHLFTDADDNGEPDDTNGDGEITADDALETTTTNGAGHYLFDDLDAGTYVVGLPPTEWASDGTLYGLLPSDPVEVDPDTDVDLDNNGAACDCADGYVFAGAVDLFGAEPTGENPDNDSVTVDPNENLTVDFGLWRPTFDLALRKVLTNPSSGTVAEGAAVTFTITIVNQGDLAATNIDIVDYLPTGLTLNDIDWAANTAGASARINGPLAPGEQTSIDITTKVGSNVANRLVNVAEISGAIATEVNGATIFMPNGQPLPDIDSTPDASNSEDPVDDEINNVDGDEDDHDLASVAVDTGPSLAVTGRTVKHVLFFGIILLVTGILLLMLGGGRLWGRESELLRDRARIAADSRDRHRQS